MNLHDSSQALPNDIVRALLEAAPDAYVITNEQGRIIFVNSQTEALFGYSREELYDGTVEMLIPQKMRTPHVDYRAAYMKNAHVRPMGINKELYGLRKDGSEFPVEISLSPTDTGWGLLITSTIRDVSDRRRTEQELKQAREAAEIANRAKSEFLANMSHEIRTPLAGILGYAEMLVHYCKTDEDRKTYINKIKRSADNLTELINDILDLSKVEAGALELEQVEFSPKNEIENAANLVESLAKEKKLSFETHVPSTFPHWVIGDPKRIRQILVNLLSNAIKFTEKGSVLLKADLIQASSDQCIIEFVVTDTGVGISPDAQSKLFRPFVQADSSTTRKFGGTGLGLALSRRLASALGGELLLKNSTVGEGSSFSAKIPFQLPSDSQVQRQERIGTPNSLKNISVLVVEDHPDVAELTSRFLKEAGAKVHIANNGEEAVRITEKIQFDVILMDIQMPVMDGYTALQMIRKNGIAAPCLAVTAHAMVEEKRKCMEAGFSDFLTKPVGSEQLLQVVAKQVEESSR